MSSVLINQRHQSWIRRRFGNPWMRLLPCGNGTDMDIKPNPFQGYWMGQGLSRAYMPPSATDDWATPRELFNELDAVHRFDLDVAASQSNHLCNDWYGLDHPDESKRNGLEADWWGHVWCNPPYGRGIKDWVLKASQHHDAVVMLLPARTDTKWFHELVLPNADVQFIKGRLKYGGGTSPAPFPSMIVRFECCG